MVHIIWLILYEISLYYIAHIGHFGFIVTVLLIHLSYEVH